MYKIIHTLCLLFLCLVMSVLDHRIAVQAIPLPLPVAPAAELSELSAVSSDVITDEKDDLQENASYGYGYYAQPFYRHYGGYYGSPYYGGFHGLGSWSAGLNSVYALGYPYYGGYYNSHYPGLYGHYF